jgi:hypothetical protein
MATVQFNKPPGGAKNVQVMPSYRHKRYGGNLASSSTAILTATSKTLIIDKILLTEYSNNARTVDLRLNQDNAADADTQYLFQDIALAAKETVVIEGPFHLERGDESTGDVLKGLASAATSVNIHIFYREEI